MLAQLLESLHLHIPGTKPRRSGVPLPGSDNAGFWTMLAHCHGQRWNGAAIARSIGVSVSTVQCYVDVLSDALVVRQFPLWHANIAKCRARSLLFYLRDSGLLHRLLGISTMRNLQSPLPEVNSNLISETLLSSGQPPKPHIRMTVSHALQCDCSMVMPSRMRAGRGDNITKLNASRLDGRGWRRLRRSVDTM